MNYSVHTKVNWNINVSSNWEDFFYPSLVKKLIKSESYFGSLFEFKITPLNSIDNAQDFLKLYDKEIASRENYVFKKNEQREMLNEKIKTGQSYFVASLVKKDTGKFAGGILFRVLNTKLFFYLRVFEKETRMTFRSLTTLDFWAEKKLYEYAFSQNLENISHGTDKYPNKGRTGLALFKLKVGGRPKPSSKEHEIIELSEEQILEYNAPTLFWTNPDGDGYFQEGHLYFKKDSLNESVLTEIIKVCEWTGIELILHNL